MRPCPKACAAAVRVLKPGGSDDDGDDDDDLINRLSVCGVCGWGGEIRR